MTKNNTLSKQQREWFEEELAIRAIRTKLQLETSKYKRINVSD